MEVPVLDRTLLKPWLRLLAGQVTIMITVIFASKGVIGPKSKLKRNLTASLLKSLALGNAHKVTLAPYCVRYMFLSGQKKIHFTLQDKGICSEKRKRCVSSPMGGRVHS